MLIVPRAIGRKIIAAALLGMSGASLRPPSRLIASSGTGDAGKVASQPTLKPVSAASPDLPLSEFDGESERQLLELANQARIQAGLSPFTLDAGLTQAARAHADAMYQARQLSHQFAGEPSLVNRLAAATRIQLDREGENVALDFSPADAQKNLMLSPPHRANLLNSAYNVIGLGVVRSGDRLYIVQDFGHALPTYSPAEAKDRIAAAINLMRHQFGQPNLMQRDIPAADAAACSMAQADKLGTSPVQQLAQRYTVLTYTTLHPETLPVSANQALRSHNLRSFSIGACYARTEGYPTGAYWVLLTLE
jgi:uncharacterized protein YkwD